MIADRPIVAGTRAVGRTLAAVVLAAGLALAACGEARDEPLAAAQETPTAEATTAGDPTPTPEPPADASPTPSLAPSAVAAGDIAELAAVNEAFAQVRSYRVQGIMTEYSTGHQIELLVETVLPDKQRFRIAREGVAMETIIIGDRQWSNIFGTWLEMPPSENAMDDGSHPEKSLEELEKLSLPGYETTYLGEETLDGVPCRVWRVVNTGENSTSTFWIGRDDHLPRKIESEFPQGRGVMRWSDFNADFDIQPPM